MVVIWLWSTAKCWSALRISLPKKKSKKRLLKEKSTLRNLRKKSWRWWPLRRKSRSSQLTIRRTTNSLLRSNRHQLKALDKCWTFLLILSMRWNQLMLELLFSLTMSKLQLMPFLRSRKNSRFREKKNLLKRKNLYSMELLPSLVLLKKQ